ncbi:MAG: elongation factor G [Eubacteriales bacterium]|nr:elongation factor G [Eubacteriales bacterium]
MIYTPDKIRNIAVVGHQGSGKTTLVESLAYKAGLISKKGSIEGKDTLSDYLPDEKKKLCSLSTSIVPITHNGYKFNLIDIPGNDDFVYELLGVTRLIKGAVLVIDASKGVQIGTIKDFKALKKRNIPTFLFINKLDKENIDFELLYEEIKEKLDKRCVPFSYPIGKQNTFDGFINIPKMKARRYNGKECVDDVIYQEKRQVVFALHNRLTEAVAETNDQLLEKYFSGEPLTDEDIEYGLRESVLKGELYPIIVGSALKDIGMNTLMDMFAEYLPSPSDLKPIIGTTEDGNNIPLLTIDEEEPVLSVFKNSFNPYQGLISIFKVNCGVVHIGDELYCSNNGKTYKVSTLFSICGEKLTPVEEVGAGDIGALTKMDDIHLSYTLSSPDKKVLIKPVKYPSSTYFKAIVPETKADSDRLFQSVEKMKLEDPTISFEKNNITNQIIIGSLSSSHLSYILDKLKDNYKVKFTSEKPKVVYKETITTKGEAEGRYIKQSGGSGYYGVVDMSFEPSEETEFTSTVFGGHVDKGYFPAVEKGFREALEHGGLIGAPVIHVKATLTDGKQHPVDSNEMAFKNAAILAFREAYEKCHPILLEPYDQIKVVITSEYLGPVLSDMSKRRGKILSTEESDEGNLEVVALVPEAEIQEYANELKSTTKGTGYFNLEFHDYEPVPTALAEAIIKEHQAEK